ncbi:MAG: isoprenylcysteine carboxylmethyltransferase family protein, partial [Candidatus Thorarchaeota archaeon]|nr:isoprenylcysteine carboxylmethyltransferase family protein [Candidatus Thorarchaeota archaeon]
KAGGPRRSRAERLEALQSEGRRSAVFFLIIFWFQVIWVALYILGVPFIDWSFFVLDEWVRFLGISLGVLSIIYLMWTLRTLGKMWSYAIELKGEHKLITSGPYARVRHPMYAAHMVFNAGIVLVTLNWVLLALLAIGIPYTYNRMFTEEKMMAERFGEEYEQYMRQTGRIFPRLRRK